LSWASRPSNDTEAAIALLRKRPCVCFSRSDSRVQSKVLEGFTVDELRKTVIRRRDMLLVVTASAVAAVVGAASIPSARTAAPVRRDKRKPQYQANSPEVQDFYRVNRYPGK
jgi:hypothetical protein